MRLTDENINNVISVNWVVPTSNKKSTIQFISGNDISKSFDTMQMDIKMEIKKYDSSSLNDELVNKFISDVLTNYKWKCDWSLIPPDNFESNITWEETIQPYINTISNCIYGNNYITGATYIICNPTHLTKFSWLYYTEEHYDLYTSYRCPIDKFIIGVKRYYDQKLCGYFMVRTPKYIDCDNNEVFDIWMGLTDPGNFGVINIGNK